MPRDLSNLLHDNHIVLDWLASRLSSDDNSSSRPTLCAELANSLGAHLFVLEDVLLPALHGCEPPVAPSDVTRNIALLRDTLAEIITTDCHADSHLERMQRLHRLLKDQRTLEASTLVPQLVRCVPSGQRVVLAAEAELALGSRATLRFVEGEIPIAPSRADS
jgi:hypothetical protein